MKRYFLVLLVIASSLSIRAQESLKDTSWKRGGFTSLTFNQVEFSHWAAGGESSLSLSGLANVFANYKKGKNFWENYGIGNYGFISTKYDQTIRKNTDKLELQSKAGHELAKKFYLAGLLNFQSQFTSGYRYPEVDTIISRFLAPGYLLVSAGIEWKPLDYLSIYLSPTTGKFTFVSNQEIANLVLAGASLYGTDPAVYDTSGALITEGKTIRSEFGAYFTAALAKDIFKNVNLTTKLALFDNYTDKNSDNRTNVDVNYDLLLNMKVTEWLGATFFTNIIYDHDIVIADVDADGIPTGETGPRTQIKEGFGLALTYKFGDQQ